MQQEINDNIKKISTWKRIFFMLILAVIVSLVRILLWTIIVLQVGSALITGGANQNVLSFGSKLSAYLYHILLFLTYSTNQVPFPFSDWGLTEDLDLPKIKK